MLWDIFISHAHEDKTDVASPLANLLKDQGLRVWIDETELTLGDSLRQKIDEGLAQSQFGVVVLSESFFAKKWPQGELSALWSREDGTNKVILPIWHNINRETVAATAPLLADKLAASTDDGLDAVVAAILEVVGGTREVTEQRLETRYAADFEFPIDVLKEARLAIGQLAIPEIWAACTPKQDMTSRAVWLGTNAEELINIFYPLYLPLCAFHQMSYSLERTLTSFTRYSQLRFALLESAYYALTHESQLATSGERIDYTPRVEHWRIKRQQIPSRYWWQGLSTERFAKAMTYFIRSTREGFPDIVGRPDFRRAYLAAYASCGRNQQDLGLLANALFGFMPKTRPVYWRLLSFWDRVYALYERIPADTTASVSEISDLLHEQVITDFTVSCIEAPYRFETPEMTWRATTEFFDRFIIPRLESYASTPIEPMGV